jgi:hypothetical protein
VWAPTRTTAGEHCNWRTLGQAHAEELDALLARRARSMRGSRIQDIDIRVEDAVHLRVDVSAGLAPAPPCWCGQVHGTVQAEPTYEG